VSPIEPKGINFNSTIPLANAIQRLNPLPDSASNQESSPSESFIPSTGKELPAKETPPGEKPSTDAPALKVNDQKGQSIGIHAQKKPAPSAVPVILSMDSPGDSGEPSIQELWSQVSEIKKKGARMSQDDVVKTFSTLRELADKSQDPEAQLLLSRLKMRAQKTGLPADTAAVAGPSAGNTSALGALFGDMNRPYLEESLWNMCADEVERQGFTPDGEMMDVLRARISAPSGQAGFSMFTKGEAGDSDFRGGVRILRLLKDRDPSLLEGMMLRDSGGNLVPFDSALASIITSDPQGGGSLGLILGSQKNPQPEQRSFMDDIQALLAGSRRVPGELLERVRNESQSGKRLEALSREGLISLALLMAGDKNGDEGKAVEGILDGHIFQRQKTENISRFVDVQRKKHSDERAGELNAGALSPPETVKAMTDIILMSLCTASAPEKALLPYDEALGRGIAKLRESADYPSCVDKLAKSVEASRAQAGRIGSMSLPDLARLELLLKIGENDRAVMSRLDSLFLPEIRKRSLKGDRADVASHLLVLFRDYKTGENLEKLQKPDLRRSERLEVYRYTKDFADFLYSKEKEDALKALDSQFLKGLDNMPDLRELPARFSSPDLAMKVFTRLAPKSDSNDEIAVAWRAFQNTLDNADAAITKLGTPNLPRSERLALLDANLEPSRILESTEGGRIRRDSIQAICSAIAGNPESGLADLPSRFSKPDIALRVYRTLAPGMELDKDIAPEWRKFCTLLDIVGQEEHLKEAVALYGALKQRESRGEEWNALVEDLMKSRILGQDYHEFIRGAFTPSAMDMLAIDDFDDTVSIGGIRLDKN
jgi:hypothetical protein